MSPGWDPQKVGQPALQQLALASPGIVQPVTCQTMISSSSTTSTSHPASKLCEDGTHVPPGSRPTAESVPTKPQKMISPGSVEIGVGTHSAEKKLSRNRAFHSSVRSADKLRNPAATVPVGAAHLVVADQERELDLSQKGNSGYGSAGWGATVVTTHESIIKPALGVVHDVSHATVTTFSSAVSQIGHLERFVRGLVTSRSESPSVLQVPQAVSDASKIPSTSSSPHDSSKAVPKRTLEQEEDSVDERPAVSPKNAKYSVADEECVSEVQTSFNNEEQSGCANTSTDDPEPVVDNQQSSSDASADAAEKQDADVDENTGSENTSSALSQPDVVTTSTQSSEEQQIPHAVVEKVNSPVECAEVKELFELDGADTSSDAEASCLSAVSEKNYLPSQPKETPDMEEVGNPKSGDASSSNPKKGSAGRMAEAKPRTSPVRSKIVTELNKKRMPVSVQEKRLDKVGTAQSEKLGRRSDEGSSSSSSSSSSPRSTSARRKRDTGGWEWFGDPETKPVYFKVNGSNLCVSSFYIYFQVLAIFHQLNAKNKCSGILDRIPPDFSLTHH